MTRRRLTRTEAIARLEQIYDSLPDVACQGLCGHEECTLINGSELERQRISERGIDLGPSITSRRTIAAFVSGGHHPRCPALSPFGTCRVYDVRPLICRAYGAAEGLRCRHGCVPDGTIDAAQLAALLDEVEELSRQVTGVIRRGEE